MLCLSRKKNEVIVIEVPGNGAYFHKIKIMITGIDRNIVSLGFDADKEIIIYREELGKFHRGIV